MKPYKSFGETLHTLMREKGCTAKELTNQMHLKSTNTIARLLADKSSPNKIQSFCEELLIKNPLGLMEYEKEQLREAVAVSTIGPKLYSANKNMLYFLRERPQSLACICEKCFGEGEMFVSTLDDLLLSYTDYSSVSILVQNCAYGGVMRSIRTLLENNKHTAITIEHYLNAAEEHTQDIRAFIHLLDVTGHPNYNLFFSPFRSGSGNSFYNSYGNIMLVVKCDENGNKFTDFLAFHSADSFSLLYNTPGEDAYEFSSYQFQMLRQRHKPAKAAESYSRSLDSMLDYHLRLLDMDILRPSVSIRPDISLPMVPPDIVKKTLEPFISTDGGVTPASYEKYMAVVIKRHRLFLNPDMQHHYLFSRSGIYNLLKTGKSKANIFGLRDLTYDERIEVLKTIVAAAKQNPLTSIHLLRNELRYNGTAFLLYGDDTLLIDNYPCFNDFDSTKCCNACWIQAPNITESFSCFARQDLIPNYTHSNEETIEFLESLI